MSGGARGLGKSEFRNIQYPEGRTGKINYKLMMMIMMPINFMEKQEKRINNK